MRGYLQATIEEFRKALASHNTGLHARARVDEARRFMGETACTRAYKYRQAPATAGRFKVFLRPNWPCCMYTSGALVVELKIFHVSWITYRTSGD